jgi:hypothetical protein
MADVTFTPVLQPAPACYPPNVNSLLTLIASQGLRGTVPDNSGGGVFVGPSPPSSSLTQKVWFQVDGAGRPLAIKMYLGSVGDIKLSAYAPGSQVDGNGRGVIGTLLDGWALCDGRNGTLNMQNLFPVCCDNWASLTSNVDPTTPNRRQAGTPIHWIGYNNLPGIFSRVHHTTKEFPGGQGNRQEVIDAGGVNFNDEHCVGAGGATIGGNVGTSHVPPFIGVAFFMYIGFA